MQDVIAIAQKLHHIGVTSVVRNRLLAQAALALRPVAERIVDTLHVTPRRRAEAVESGVLWGMCALEEFKPADDFEKFVTSSIRRRLRRAYL